METFMVRVWKLGGEARSERVRGTAVHLGSGRRITFTEPGRLIDFLGETVTADGLPAPMLRSPDSVGQEYTP
jgi:hypothetical protein